MGRFFSLPKPPRQRFHKDLTPSEIEWAKLQPFLLRRGYALRARYRPGWTPSWKKLWNFHKDELDSEDWFTVPKSNVMDATRISDGKQVVIKMVSTSRNELPIMMFLNQSHMRQDPRNNFVEVLEVLLAPDTDDIALVVMPKLIVFGIIPFQFVSEVIDAFVQFFEGLAFFHDHNIAHLDACFLNMLMDATDVAVDDFHFAEVTRRTKNFSEFIRYRPRKESKRVNYFLIDTGISIMYPPGCHDRTLRGSWGAEKNVPEHQMPPTPVDPFQTDVYQMGMVLKRFTKGFEGLAMLEQLACTLTSPNPSDRPKASEAADTLKELLKSLPRKELNQRIWYANCPMDVRQRVESGPESVPRLLSMWGCLSTNAK